jgi:hypothetical protein
MTCICAPQNTITCDFKHTNPECPHYTPLAWTTVERIDKFCQMCGATPGHPCTYVSTIPPDHEAVVNRHERPHEKGDVRPEPHWARDLDRPAAVLIPDEPPIEYA